MKSTLKLLKQFLVPFPHDMAAFSWVAEGKHKLCLGEDDGAGVKQCMQAATASLCAEVPGYMQTCFYLMCKSSKSTGDKKWQFIPKQKVRKVQDGL